MQRNNLSTRGQQQIVWILLEVLKFWLLEELYSMWALEMFSSLYTFLLITIRNQQIF